MELLEREREFYNNEWKRIRVTKIEGKLDIPGLSSLSGKKLLICSCGTGIDAVKGAKQGATVYAFDISEVAVENAKKMAEFNDVEVYVDRMDFHHLEYDENSFDVIYGAAILHHVDCEIVGKELYRVLKPGGVAFFRENSDRNPLLRFLRRLMFGQPGGFQKQKFLMIQRRGTNDEYPLTEEEVDILSNAFGGNLQRFNERFYFFHLLDYLIFKNKTIGKFFWNLDSFTGTIFPWIKKYSFLQEILLIKK